MLTQSLITSLYKTLVIDPIILENNDHPSFSPLLFERERLGLPPKRIANFIAETIKKDLF